MDIAALIISLVGGAIGGSAAGALPKNLRPGPIGNSLVGIPGGGLGGRLPNMPGMAGGAVKKTVAR